MKTFTGVDDQAYPGTLTRGWFQHANLTFVFRSRLSAQLPDGNWMDVEHWADSEESAATADELRFELAKAIKQRGAN